MEQEPQKIATLEGNGFVLREGRRLETHYYLDVFEEDPGAAPGSKAGARRYSGMLARLVEALLEVDDQYTLVLEDGRQLRFLVTGRHFSIMGPGQYGIVGRGDLESA